MSELNYEDYFPPVTELEDYKNKEFTGDDGHPKYLSDDENISNTADGIQPQDNNRLGGKILAVWERYKPLLDHNYSRSVYILSMDIKIYAHAKVSVLHIYVNYHVIFIQFIIPKIIELCLIYIQYHYTSEDCMTMVQVIRKLYCYQSEEELGQTIEQFLIDHETL